MKKLLRGLVAAMVAVLMIGGAAPAASVAAAKAVIQIWLMPKPRLQLNLQLARFYMLRMQVRFCRLHP